MAEYYLAIYEQKFIAQGSLEEIIRQVKAIDSTIEPIVLEVESCNRVEFSWRGDTQTVLENIPKQQIPIAGKRGRPKLGVISKEITLLPRHWEWLATQRGGASVTLRKLVDQAQRNVSVEDIIFLKQAQLDRFMLLFAGDLQGFEEAGRALYRNSKVSFEEAVSTWPTDIKHFALNKFNDLSNIHNGNT